MAVLINIVGSAALLIWGIRMVRTAVTRSFGAELRAYLSHALSDRLRAFSAGLGITLLLQSSTATALIVASFSNTGALGAAMALAILLGADVGTTLVVQIFSQRIEWLSPALTAIGVSVFLGSQRARWRNVGRGLIGIGLIMLALAGLKSAAQPIASSSVVQSGIDALSGEPALAIVVMAALTVLVHSSVATVLLVGSLAGAGAISLEQAIDLVLGANLGGALLPVMATWFQPGHSRIAPISNAVLRTVSVLIAVPLAPSIAGFVTQLGGGAVASVAHVHTLFNLALALIGLPIVTPIAAIVGRLFTGSATFTTDPIRLNLSTDGHGNPAVALAGATREAIRVGDIIEEMLERTMVVLRDNDSEHRKYVAAMDDEVDRIHESIKIYLTRLMRDDLDDEAYNRSQDILNFTTNLEHIGDIIDKNLMELAAKKHRTKATFSHEGQIELEEFHDEVRANMRRAMSVFISSDRELARELIVRKIALRDKERDSINRHYERLGTGKAQSIDTSAIHLDILRDLKRINSHLTTVAYPILERAGELTATRLRDSDAA